jgi:hypothetical protein
MGAASSSNPKRANNRSPWRFAGSVSQLATGRDGTGAEKADSFGFELAHCGSGSWIG